MSGREGIRIALLGCGHHSTLNHAAPLAHYAAEHPGEIELAAACDLDVDRAGAVAREFGFAEVYGDLDRMYAQASPDGVVCVMPLAKLAEVGVEVLRRGVPCSIEKPLGTSAAQAQALARAAGGSGTPHMVSMNRRHWPHLVRGREWIGDRPVRLIRAGIYRRARTEKTFIWGTAIHPVDTMVHLAGAVADYEAQRVEGPELAAGWYSVTMHFAGGCRGELLIAPTCGRVEETYELFGEDFCVRVAAAAEEAFTLQCWEQGRLVIEETSDVSDRPWLGNGAYGEARAFVAALRDGTPMAPTVADVLPATEICFDLARRFA